MGSTFKELKTFKNKLFYLYFFCVLKYYCSGNFQLDLFLSSNERHWSLIFYYDSKKKKADILRRQTPRNCLSSTHTNKRLQFRTNKD